jgi:uncharacterized protein (TIGR02452 family)
VSTPESDTTASMTSKSDNPCRWFRMLTRLPCLDSVELASRRRGELDIDAARARALGWSALEAIRQGRYARPGKVSIPPDAPLPRERRTPFPETRVLVANETTLAAARRLTDGGLVPLSLNFANGVEPGGGFLRGARAQEEVLCQSSTLFATLDEDAMYEAHRRTAVAEASDWAILSTGVTVFRDDRGEELEAPWTTSVLTCAAPYAPAVGQPRSGDLLQGRIRRVLDIGSAYGYDTLVLGAWGCGAFQNDPARTARDFRSALEDSAAFREVVFAIADWSPERRFLGPFRDVLGGEKA